MYKRSAKYFEEYSPLNKAVGDTGADVGDRGDAVVVDGQAIAGLEGYGPVRPFS